MGKGKSWGRRRHGGGKDNHAGPLAASGTLALRRSEKEGLEGWYFPVVFLGQEAGCGLGIKEQEGGRSLQVEALHHHPSELPGCKENFVASRGPT